MKISHPEDLKEDLKNMTKLHNGDIDEFIMEKRLYAKDGSIVWVNLTVSPMWAQKEKPDFHIAIIENITEQKNTQFALKESEEKHRSLIENMNDSVVLVDLNGTITYVNKKFSSISGYTKQEAIGKNVVKLLLKPELQKGFEDKMNERKHGKSDSYEIDFYKKDGENLIVKINASPIYDKGIVVGSMTILSNITENKKKEKLQRTLYAIANYTNKRVTITSLCEFVHFELSKIIEAESFFVALHDSENNLLKFPYSADNPDNVVIIRKDFERPYNNGLSEYIIETKKTLLFDKKELDRFLAENPQINPYGKNALSWMAAPLLVNGIVLGVIGVQSYIKDNIYSQKDLEVLSFISEQLATGIQKIQTQNHLIKSEEKFRKIFESITDVYYQADMNGIITLISPSSLAILGYSPNELVGKPISIFYENPNLRTEFMKLLLKVGKVENYETSLIGYSKEKIHISANISLRYNDQGEPIGIQGVLHNITEKKKQEEELIKREKLLREAQQIAKLGSWEWNIQSNQLLLSNEMFSILEIDPKSFDNKLDSLKKIIHPDSASRFSEILFNAVNNFKSVDVELKIITENKNEKILLLRASSQLETKNTETIIHGTVLDITELKKSIDLVVKSESKFRKIFESITDVYYQADMNGKILTVSPSCFKLSGYHPEELIGVSLTALFDNPKAKKMVLKKINNLETKLISKSGKLIYISANINLLLDSNNIPIGTQGIIRNISENKKHEEQLKSSLKLNQGIINATDQMFYVVKIESEKIGTNPFTYISPQSELYYGLTPNEIISNPEVWFNCIHPDDIANVVEKSKLLYEKKEPITRIYRIKRVDKNEDIWVEDYVYPVLNEFGEIQELYGSINDITPLKNKEIDLQNLSRS
jgi:PAS domain S-box-containing protein